MKSKACPKLLQKGILYTCIRTACHATSNLPAKFIAPIIEDTLPFCRGGVRSAIKPLKGIEQMMEARLRNAYTRVYDSSDKSGERKNSERTISTEPTIIQSSLLEYIVYFWTSESLTAPQIGDNKRYMNPDERLIRARADPLSLSFVIALI